MTHHRHEHAAHEHAAHEHGAHEHDDDAGLGELLDLDAVALAASWAQVHALVAQAAPASVRTVVDLGAGTGTGTAALARLFPDATVVAVDSNPALPTRLAGKALGERVRAVVADLDHGWPDLGPVDVVWASMALHHLGEPDRSLREVFEAVVPGGLLVAVEFDEPVRVLGAGVAGDVEDRAMAVLRRVHEREVPEIGSHWADRFAAASFEVVGEEAVAVDVAPPVSPEAVRYAQLWLGRIAARAGDLDPVDRTTLQHLAADLDPALVHLRGVRTVTLARRP
ncbi:class I SAM-dependent methyltransferase [Jatrophihabitans sp. YIM 134969]